MSSPWYSSSHYLWFDLGHTPRVCLFFSFVTWIPLSALLQVNRSYILVAGSIEGPLEGPAFKNPISLCFLVRPHSETIDCRNTFNGCKLQEILSTQTLDYIIAFSIDARF